MKIYKLHKKQKLPITLEKAWEFLSNPKNLSNLTPPEMNFTIVSGADRPMFAGQIIQYIVTPVLGIKTNWVTEITQVKDDHFFIDEQRVGPYALWHHQHFFEEHPDGVQMTDIVHYIIPFGVIGRFANWLFIRKQLEGIFNYRTTQVNKIFQRNTAKTIHLNALDNY